MFSNHPLKLLCSWILAFGLWGVGPTVGLVFAQNGYEKLKDFGNSELLGRNPQDALLPASDGALYGVTASGGKWQLGTIFKVNKDGTGYYVLHSFGAPGDGQVPLGGLLEAADGFLYGTTSSGEAFGMGVIYRILKDGSAYQILYRFNSYPDGGYATGRLIQAPDGGLYGTTANGGNDTNATSGVVFRFEPESTNFTVLHYFSGSDGRVPSGALVLGTDGALYGTTHYGGTFDDGVVFRITLDGNNFSALRMFTWSDTQGKFPNELIEASDGMLYGTASYGGTGGVIFKLSKTGTGFNAFNLPANGPKTPYAAVVEAVDGFLYGTCSEGGSNSQGAVFKLAKDWTRFSVVHEFGSVSSDGQAVFFPLAKGDGSNLYGLAGGGRSGDGLIFKYDTSPSTYQIIRHLSASGGDAANPIGKLVECLDGDLYGISETGGSAGSGAVFRIHIDGTKYQLVHEFTDSGAEGARPSVILAGGDGAFYGVAASGGSFNAGTIFRITTNGSLSVLHSFAGSPIDGQEPNGLVQCTDGYLYGTTHSGGNSNLGTIFRLSINGGNYALLHNLGQTASDGAEPLSGVIEGSDGALYGVSERGVTNYLQKVYRINKDGTGYRLLVELPFAAAEIQAAPLLMEGTDGWLYGTHSTGDAPYSGSIYKLRKDGSGFARLHNFAADGNEGWWPKAGLLEGENGLLYGTTSYNGSGGGTVFRVAKDGSGFSVVYSFGSRTNDGTAPRATLLQGYDGRLYGTTAEGGEMSLGSIFRLATTELTQVRMSWSNSLPLLRWNAVNGTKYTVQWKASMAASVWQSLGTNVIATGPDAFIIDDSASPGSHFYRVLCQP